MNEEIHVRVVEFGDRSHYQLQWNDPLTGRKKTKSSRVKRTGKKADRDKAIKEAAKFEEQLQQGAIATGARMPWDDFRTRYEKEVAQAKAPATASKIVSVFNWVEEIMRPQKLGHLTAERISGFQAELRIRGHAESSIKSNLAHLKAALRWAERIGLIPRAPAIVMPSKAGDKARGRPITAEEYDRMLAKVEAGLLAASSRSKRPAKGDDKVSAPPRRRVAKASATRKTRRAKQAAADAPAYRRLLRGLWFSGLRLNEALNLFWDRDDRLRVDLSGRRPMLRIPAALNKNRKEQLLAITPDFAAFLLKTSSKQRRGRVFDGVTSSRSEASRIIAAIGEAALVKIREVEGEVQYATAHDLRRSFGERWAARVMPHVLKELMRHEVIETTMKYYVGCNAQRTADAVWAAAERVSEPVGAASN